MAKNQLFVLDASALIALVCQERGWNVINAILASGNAVATPIAIAEAFGSLRRKKSMKSQRVLDDLLALGLEIVELLPEDAREMDFIQERADLAAAKIKSPKQLSIADAACMAVGDRLNATVVFSDNFWNIVDLPGIEIQAFR